MSLVPEAVPTAEPALAGTHPEEIKGTIDLRFGRSFSMTSSGRITPAGLICGAIAASAILLSVATLVRAIQTRKNR